jgi:hypothetical protein
VKIRTCSALIVTTVLLIGAGGAIVNTDYDRHAYFFDYKTYSLGAFGDGQFHVGPACEKRN